MQMLKNFAGERKRAQIAAETLAIFERDKGYRVGDEVYAIDTTFDNFSVHYEANEKITFGPALYDTRIQFAQETSIQAFWSSGYPCILNFASAIKPGGGWLSGKQAQEESLCRASGLGFALKERGCRPFYAGNKDSGIYSDAIIYSPDVPVIRDGNEELCEPALCSFITCAAINAKRARKTLTQEEIRALMLKRARRILACAAQQGQRNIILGSWGTGVFENNVEDVAGIFKELLEQHKAFENVLFAIPDKATFDRFRAVFAE